MPEQRGRTEADDIATRQRVLDLTDPAAMISTDPGNQIRVGSDGRLFIGDPPPLAWAQAEGDWVNDPPDTWDDALAVADPASTVEPVNPRVGQTYFDTDLGCVRSWDGATWVVVMVRTPRQG